MNQLIIKFIFLLNLYSTLFWFKQLLYLLLNLGCYSFGITSCLLLWKDSSANISRSPFIKLSVYSTMFVIIKTFIKKKLCQQLPCWRCSWCSDPLMTIPRSSFNWFWVAFYYLARNGREAFRRNIMGCRRGVLYSCWR